MSSDIKGSFSFSGETKGTYQNYTYEEPTEAKLSETISNYVSYDLQKKLTEETGLAWSVKMNICLLLGEREIVKRDFLQKKEQPISERKYKANFNVECSWKKTIPEESDLLRRVQAIISKSLK